MWSEWLLRRRHAGDPRGGQDTPSYLRRIRNRVLANAAIENGDVVLDVGCGDGLLAFAALERTQALVIFSDISQALLEHCRQRARGQELLNRCRFLQAPATDLGILPDGSVSVVLLRNVLIHVRNKAAAFRELHRVLAPGGRLSLFEPINSFSYPPPENDFAGYDVSAVVSLARKVKDAFAAAQQPEGSPMIDFDERDLIRCAQDAGFVPIRLQLNASVGVPRADISWETFLRQPPNPLALSLQEAVSRALTHEEAEMFLGHLKPLVEARQGRLRAAAAYLWGTKPGVGG